MPIISVIVPVYKVEPYLHRCVDSILGQTFTDFELILVDDGSPDNCPAICDEYAAKDRRVHVIHQENGGLSAARNAGIDWAFENSDSQWLSFIDSDDWVHPQMLEILLDAARKYQTDISLCGYTETESAAPQILHTELECKQWNVEDYYVSNIVNATIACAKLYCKGCFENIRYPAGKLHEDEFTTYRILFAQEKIAVIAAPLYYYFVNTAGITKSTWSPKRLASLEAKEQQIAYFKENGYHAAYERAIDALFWNIATHIQKIQATAAKENEVYEKKLRRLLRSKLKQYRRILGLSLHKNYSIFEVAYPRFMKYYWLWQVVLKKLHIRK